MDWTGIRRQHWRAAFVVVALGTAVSVSACGSAGGGSAGSSSSAGLPSTINVVSTEPLTGDVAFVGISADDGYKLAIQQINSEKFLGNTKLEMTTQDTTGNAQTAASLMSQAVADKNVSAAFGSVVSGDAIAQSTIAQKAGMPVVYTQAGSAGVVVGDYTYRATPLMSSYYPIIKTYIQQHNWKSIGIIYTNTFPTLQEVGQTTLPALAKELGMTVTSSVETTSTTTDFTAPIAQVLRTKPDVVAVLEVGASNPTAMTQLRQAGYTGPVLGNSAASGGTLTPAGTDGDDMVWPVDFDYQQKDATSQQFVAQYKAAYGSDPLNYAAEAYDAAWFLARSIKDANSASRVGIKNGMAMAAAKPMNGALGSGLVWKDGTLEVPGVVVEWTGSTEKLLYSASGS